MSVYKRKAAVGPFSSNSIRVRTASAGVSLLAHRTKNEAEIAEREALYSKDRGIEMVPSKITLDQLFERFIRDGSAQPQRNDAIRLSSDLEARRADRRNHCIEAQARAPV